jgi:hypothetical protein
LGIILLWWRFALGVYRFGSIYDEEKLIAAGNLSDMSLLYCDIDFLTEFTSNTATTEMMLPIVAGLTNQIQINPLFIMIPVTMPHRWHLCFLLLLHLMQSF